MTRFKLALLLLVGALPLLFLRAANSQVYVSSQLRMADSRSLQAVCNTEMRVPDGVGDVTSTATYYRVSTICTVTSSDGSLKSPDGSDGISSLDNTSENCTNSGSLGAVGNPTGDCSFTFVKQPGVTYTLTSKHYLVLYSDGRAYPNGGPCGGTAVSSMDGPYGDPQAWWDDGEHLVDVSSTFYSNQDTTKETYELETPDVPWDPDGRDCYSQEWLTDAIASVGSGSMLLATTKDEWTAIKVSPDYKNLFQTQQVNLSSSLPNVSWCLSATSMTGGTCPTEPPIGSLSTTDGQNTTYKAPEVFINSDGVVVTIGLDVACVYETENPDNNDCAKITLLKLLPTLSPATASMQLGGTKTFLGSVNTTPGSNPSAPINAWNWTPSAGSGTPGAITYWPTEGTSQGTEATQQTYTYAPGLSSGPQTLTLQVEVDLSRDGGNQHYQLDPVTATIRVGASQTILWSQNLGPVQSIGQSIALTAVASSGLPVVYTSQNPEYCIIQGSGSTASVSFIAAGPCQINADQPGNDEYAPAPTVTQGLDVTDPNAPPSEPPSVDVGEVKLGITSSTVAVVFTFGTSDTLASIDVLTLGASGLDFSNAGTGTCTLEANYVAGSRCTVDVTFTPSLAGIGTGEILLKNSSGSILAQGFLKGIGVGSTANYLPGEESILPASTLQGPMGVSVDRSGNIYIADTGNNRILKETVSSGGGYTESVISTSSLNSPTGVALDSGGGVYVVDSGHNRILRESPSPDGYTEIVLPTSVLINPSSIAVDWLNNVYIADSGNERVLKESPSAGTYVESTVPTRILNGLSGLAVDGRGDVIVSDSFSNSVLKETLTAGGYTESLITTSSLNSPSGIAVDSVGSIYISDSANNRVLKEVPSEFGYIETSFSNGSSHFPSGVAVDGRGRVFISDSGNSRVLKEDLSLPRSLTFGPTAPGSTSSDSPQSLVIQNAGNDVLAFSLSDIPQSFAINSDAAIGCALTTSGSSTTGSILVGKSCVIPVSFTPTAPGVSSGILTLTGSGLDPNNPSSIAQMEVALSGVGTGASPQTITFASIAAQKVNTTLALTATASSGLQVNFVSATPAVCVVSASSASLIGTGMCTIQATQAGSTIFSAAPVVAQSFSVDDSLSSGQNFNAINVGSASTSNSLVFTYDQETQLGSVLVLTQGAPGLDFKNAGTGTCAVGSSYNAGDSCTVDVSFTPTLAGVRYGAVVLNDASVSIIATGYLQGSGVGSQINFLPGTELTEVTSTMSYPSAVIIDSAGNLFIADTGNNRILKETPGSAGYTESTLPTSSLSSPEAIAVDGGGNIYIADFGNNRILLESLSSGIYVESTIPTSSLNGPEAVGVDGSGNVYIADTNNNRILKEARSSTTFTESVVSTSPLSNPDGIAVDGAGNMFIADWGNNRVLKETVTANSYVESVVPTSTLNGPGNVAVDSLGNVYIADSGNNRLLKETLSSGVYSEHVVPTGLLNSPYGVALDGYGNQYIADTGNNRVLKEDISDPPTITFETTAPNVTSGDSPKIVTVNSVGNAALHFSVPASGSNPGISAGFVLDGTVESACPELTPSASAPATLNVGESCSLPISFIPTSAGPISGALVLVDDAPSATGTGANDQQVVILNGIGTGSTQQTITFGPIPTQSANSTLLLSATASSGLPVSFSSITPTICTISASTVSLLTFGTCSVQAIQMGNPTYAPAEPVSETFSVVPIAQNITFIAIPTQILNTSVPVKLSANADSNLPVSFATSTPSVCSVSGKVTTLMSIGTCTIQASQSGNSVYAAAPVASQTFAVTSANSLERQQFGDISIGGASSVIGVTVTFSSAGQLATVLVVTNGQANLEFTGAGSGSCQTSISYDMGDSCIVNVIFRPMFSGARLGAVVLEDASQNVIGLSYLQGSGIGPQINFLPGTESEVPVSSPVHAYGVAVDGNDDVVIADYGNNRVLKETLSNGVYSESVLPTSDWIAPDGVAVDGSGNIYIADEGNNQVLKETLSGSSYVESILPTSALSWPAAVAVDSSGNVYIADLFNNRVLKETFSQGVYTESLVPTSALNIPTGVAVDGEGNVYIVDGGNGRVLKESLSGDSYTESVIPNSSPNNAWSVAVDAHENIYITGFLGEVLKEIPSGGGYIESVVPTRPLNCGAGAGAKGAIAVDKHGNIFVPDLCDSALLKENLSDPPSLEFVLPDEGSNRVGSPQTVQIENIGNSVLNLPVLSSGSNPSITPGFILNSDAPSLCPVASASSSEVGAIQPGGTCLLSISPAPGEVDGLSGMLVITDNSLNMSPPGYASQSIGLTVVGSGNTTGTSSTQIIYFPSIPDSPVGTIINLSATASSGLPVTYSLATYAVGVCTITNSTVTMLGQGVCRIQANQAGNSIFMPAPPVIQSFNVNYGNPLLGSNLGEINLGTSSSVSSALLTFGGPGTLDHIVVLTEGSIGGDFSDAGTGTCVSAKGYNGGETCSVNIVFTPTAVGIRYGAIVAVDGSGSVIAAGYLYGVGVGASILFMPATESSLSLQTSSSPYQIAVDGGGNILIVDSKNNQILKEAPLNGSYVESVVPTSTLNNPSAVAVDGGGNIYIADLGNDRVLKETPSGNSYSESQVNTAYVIPTGVAVDGSGNVYISDCNSNQVLVETLLAGSYGYSENAVQSSQLNTPAGIAVDGSANLYIADTGNNRVLKETLSAGSYTESTVPTSVQNRLSGIAVDRLNNLYVVDSIGNRILKETTSAGGYVESTVQTSNLNSPIGVAVDVMGNVLVSDTGHYQVLREDLSDPPNLSFTATVGGSPSSGDTQVITVENSGNAPLHLPVLSSGSNPSITANFTLNAEEAATCPIVNEGASTAGMLAVGQSCLLSVTFLPVSTGTIAGTLLLTDDAFDSAFLGNARQSILLNGIGTGGEQQTITFEPILTQSANSVFGLTAAASSGLTVGFSSSTPSVCTISGSIATMVRAGSCTLQATQVGSAVYAPAPVVTQTFLVNLAAQTITFGSIPQQSVNTTLPLSAFASSGLPVGFRSVASTICSVSGSIVSLLNSGTCSIEVTQGGDAVYAVASPVMQSFVVNSEASVATPSFSPSSGSYSAPQTVVISDSTPNSTIYYTSDGTTPTTASSVYTIPIVVSTTNTLNAIALASGYSASAIGTATYTMSTHAISVPTEGNIGTIIGNGTQGYLGDGGQASGAELNLPAGVAVDSAGNIYVADYSNNVIRIESASTGVISTIAGNGTPGYSGDGGAATSAELNGPEGIAVDSAGNLYIADQNNCALRKVVISTGIITTVAGVADDPWGGYSGDGGPAIDAELSFPNGVSLDASGNIYIADQYNNVIRKVTATTGIISTVAGSGSPGYSGDSGVATSAELNFPTDVHVDSAGNIFIADYNNFVIREVAASTGTITTVAGNGTQGYSGDGGPATSATFGSLAFLALDPVGNIYVSDSANEVIRKVTASTGTISTVAGIGTSGYSGDGGLAIAAQLNSPAGVAVAQAGTSYSTTNLYFADSSNNVIRAVGGYATAAPTFSPISATYSTAETVTISDSISGATIHYTTDGTLPTISSPLYSGPITVSSTETLKAIAITSTGFLSAVGTAPYTITTTTPAIDFASGFTSTNLTLVNDASIASGALQLSDGGGGEERAVWFNTPVSSLAFTSDFNYQATSAVADGMTFTLQNDPTGLYALGDGGGGLGYGGIESSVAVKLDLYSNMGEGTDSTGVYSNGTLPYLPALDMTSSGVVLRSGNLIHVHILYDGTTLTWTITDTVTNANYTASKSVNIPSVVGGNTAYVGFTAATGTFASTQSISNWTFIQ